MSEFEGCIRQGRLVRFRASPAMVEKELKGAQHDLKSARASREHGDDKWASVQAYYSMFHCAKALVLAKGYREKSHLCLVVALRELYVKEGTLDERVAGDFELVMNLRHEADYGLAFSRDGARLAIEMAERMLGATKHLLDDK